MISQFKNEYRWLSNFAPVTIIIDGIEFDSVEHAYMAHKSNDENWKKFCKETKNPGEVKKQSYKIKLVDDWEQIKVSAMKKCLEQKFSQSPYKELLLSTGDEYIQEGNNWGDTFWGVSLKTGKGKNVLGKLIMQIRNNLTNEKEI